MDYGFYVMEVDFSACCHDLISIVSACDADLSSTEPDILQGQMACRPLDTLWIFEALLTLLY